MSTCYNSLPEDDLSGSKHVMQEALWKMKFHLTEVHFIGLYCMIISECTAQITKYSNSFGIVSKLQAARPRNQGSIPYSTKRCLSSPGKPTPAHQFTQSLTEGVQRPLLLEESREWSWLYTATFTSKFMYISKEQYSTILTVWITALGYVDIENESKGISTLNNVYCDSNLLKKHN
jgi:hypothetical protein